MPWRGVTVSEQRERFLEDYRLSYYSLNELAERFNISRKTAYKWIDRFNNYGKQGYHELSRRPRSCPWQTDKGIAEELIGFRKAHPSWGPRKLLDLLCQRRSKLAHFWRVKIAHSALMDYEPPAVLPSFAFLRERDDGSSEPR
jgi:transposase